MKKKIRKLLPLAAAAAVSALLTGCHGAQEKSAFSIPETFDTSRQYELRHATRG